MKVFFYKRVQILFISIIFKAKTVILPNAILYQHKYSSILVDTISHLEATFNLIRPEFFFIKLAEFFDKFAENLSILKP